MTNLIIGGTEPVLCGLIDSFELDPGYMLAAFAPLPLFSATRHSILVALQAAVKAQFSFSYLLCHECPAKSRRSAARDDRDLLWPGGRGGVWGDAGR